jgi:hypothetical protein
LHDAIKSITDLPVKSETQVSPKAVADLLVNLGAGKFRAVDVAIVSPYLDLAPEPEAPNTDTWPNHLKNTEPSQEQVSDDDLTEHVLSRVKRFRQGCWEGAIGLTITRHENRKRAHYSGMNSLTAMLCPFVMTSGGSIGKGATEMWNFIKKSASDSGARRNAKLRFACSRVGVTLLKMNAAIADCKNKYK